MYSGIEGTLDRADELLADLLDEYDKSLQAKEVTDRAQQLTHEVCERLRSVLDRLARRYWELHLKPGLDAEDEQKASVYFPIAPHEDGFGAIMGRWRWKLVRADHAAVEAYLRNLQPYTHSRNEWLGTLNALANHGKHIDLVPQKKTEEVRQTVKGPGGGAVSWGPGVFFGGGVSIHGAPIDPATQRIRPTPGVSQTTERWVAFIIPDFDINAAGFCKDACAKTRSIAEEMTEKFDLD